MKKRRGRKPKSLVLTRDLSKNEIFLIGYLWRWKVAPASLLKEAAFRKSSPWTFYKILKRLIKEKILKEIPGGKYFSHRLLALTEFGFEIYLRDFDYINRFRFRVHAPAHDYLATALQLGDFVFPPEIGMERFSEQELQTYLPDQLPYGYQQLTENQRRRPRINTRHA